MSPEVEYLVVWLVCLESIWLSAILVTGPSWRKALLASLAGWRSCQLLVRPALAWVFCAGVHIYMVAQL